MREPAMMIRLNEREREVVDALRERFDVPLAAVVRKALLDTARSLADA